MQNRQNVQLSSYSCFSTARRALIKLSTLFAANAFRLSAIEQLPRTQLSLALKRRQRRLSESCTVRRSKASELKELMLPRDAGDARSRGIGAP